VGEHLRFRREIATTLRPDVRAIGIIIALAGLVTGCIRYNVSDDPRVKSMCAKVIAENTANPPLNGVAFRYMERDAPTQAAIRWPEDSSGALCDGPCQELAGHFGYSLYMYVTNEEIQRLRDVGAKYPGHFLKEFQSLKSPGIYRFSLADRSGCDARTYFKEDGRLVPNGCVLPERIDDRDASAISSLPIIVADVAPKWLPTPPNPPPGFKWDEIIRVFDRQGQMIFHAVDPAMDYGFPEVGSCPGHVEPMTDEALYQSLRRASPSRSSR
jgi:hypothetical protein